MKYFYGFASGFVTFPALQKTFVDFLFEFTWRFGIEKCRGFWVSSFWSPSPTKRSTKTTQKFGENPDQNSGRQKQKKIRELSFCDFSDLRICLQIAKCVVPKENPRRSLLPQESLHETGFMHNTDDVTPLVWFNCHIRTLTPIPALKLLNQFPAYFPMGERID